MKIRSFLMVAAILSCAVMDFDSLRHAQGEFRIADICRIKGQEEVHLQGLGLVVGLSGTGDEDIKPTTRALARMLQLMGNPLPQNVGEDPVLQELKDSGNVAMVFVTATIPAAGAREGDKLNCSVTAISAKSLEGGYLMTTPLLGPRPGNPEVYAVCQGPVYIEDKTLTAGKVHKGCKVQANFQNQFISNGKLHLVLTKDHAGFHNAQEIEDLLNNQPDFNQGRDSEDPVAHAIDQVNVEVTIPEKYAQTPVLFASLVMNTKVYTAKSQSRVVIREREGVVIIGQNVSIGAVAVSHNNLTIEAGGRKVGQFVPLDPEAANEPVRLKALVQALNALQVETKDVIDIIKGLERSGDLYGELIVE